MAVELMEENNAKLKQQSQTQAKMMLNNNCLGKLFPF